MFQVAVSRGLGRAAWRIHVFQRGHCGWAGSVGRGVPVSPAECRAYQASALWRIRALRPELLVLSQADGVMPYRTATDMSSALATFVPLAGRVVVLGHTPTVPSFDVCLSGSSNISNCVVEVSGSYRAETARERALAVAGGAVFVDTSRWVCTDLQGRRLCPAVIDGAPVWRDGTHLTSDIEAKLVPLLGSLLRSRDALRVGSPEVGPGRGHRRAKWPGWGVELPPPCCGLVAQPVVKDQMSVSPNPAGQSSIGLGGSPASSSVRSAMRHVLIAAHG